MATVLLAADLGAATIGNVFGTPGSARRGTSVAAAVPAQVGQCVAGWQEQPIPDVAFISTPFDVITRNGQPAWIVGGANVGVMTLRWNGSGWLRAAGATRGHRGLVGGVAVGARKVLGVGYYRPFGPDDDSALVPMSGRVSGAAWKDLDVPRPPGSRATLTDVASLGGNDAWAVGTRLDGGRLRAWAARLDGSRWTRNEPSTKGGSGLLAIDRAPSGELWTVGWQEQRAGQPRPYIATLQKGRWRSVKPPSLPDGTAVLTDVEMRDAREGWAVGYLVPKRADRHIAFLLRWDGRRWTRRSLPWANEVAAVPRSVSAGEDGRVWIAGTQTANEQREARGFVASGAGDSWSVDVLGVPADVRSEVMDVAATSQGAVAVANVGASLLVLHTCQVPATPAAKAKAKANVNGHPHQGQPHEGSSTGAGTSRTSPRSSRANRPPSRPSPSRRRASRHACGRPCRRAASACRTSPRRRASPTGP